MMFNTTLDGLFWNKMNKGLDKKLTFFGLGSLRVPKVRLLVTKDNRRRSPTKTGSHIKLELAKYYKDSDMTAYISERSRNSKGLKKYNPPKNEK